MSQGPSGCFMLALFAPGWVFVLMPGVGAHVCGAVLFTTVILAVIGERRERQEWRRR